MLKKLKQILAVPLLLSIFCLLIPSISQAAPTDCSQLSVDGQRDCISPITTYTGSFAGKYSSLEEIIQAYKEIQCNTGAGFSQCSLKTTSAYKTPSTCTQTNNCMLYTRVLGTPGNYAQVVVEKYKDFTQTWAVDSRGLIYKSDACPIGYSKVTVNANEQTSLCKPPQSTRSVFCEDCVKSQLGQSQIAHPVNLNSGIMSHIEHDYQGNGLFVNRYYNSVSNNWFFSYSRKLGYNSILLNNILNEFLTLTRDNGIAIVFKKNSTGIWENLTPNSNGLIYDLNTTGNNNLALFKYLNENNELESYDVSGKIIEIKSLSGQKININYISDNAGAAPVLYTKISDDFNHSIQYKVLPNNTCPTTIVNAKVFEKINGIEIEKLNYDYGYNTSCQNNSITYPNSLNNTYTYTNSSRLSSIVDENNQVKVKWTYTFNSARNQYVVTSTGLTSTGNINKNTLTYNTTNTSQFVNKTNGLNQSTAINQQDNNGALSTTDYSTGYCSDCDGFQGKNTIYDSRGNIISYQDFNNNSYQLTYDNQSRVLQQKSAVGTSIENTVNYTWHLNTNLPETIQTPVSGGIKTTQFIYDDVFETINGQNILVKSQLKQINVSAPDNLNLINPNLPTTIITQSAKYYYNNLNQLIRIENPRFVQSNGLINDVFTLTYENNQVKTVTNGLNQTTTYANYNVYGQPGFITTPNGVQSLLTYDNLGRILTSTLIGSDQVQAEQETTSFDYENTGLLKKITVPTGQFMKLYYDAAYRLSKVEQYDALSHYLGKVEFTLDNMSNLTNINVYNWQLVNGVYVNQLIRTSSAQYDSKNRLFKAIGAFNQTTEFNYDSNNNLTQIKDAANYLTTSTYDALNRLQTTLQADGGTVNLSYTPDGLTASVKDPKNLETVYIYDGFGNLIQLNSPDTGISTMTYDIGNNLINSVDANLNQVNYVYDAINRVMNINYPQQVNLNTTLIYDNCVGGLGQVCSIQDKTGIQSYAYNPKGRLKTHNYQYNTFVGTYSNKITQYDYEPKGQLKSVTYPSGKIITYTYNNNSQIAQIDVNNFKIYNSANQQVQIINQNILNNTKFEVFNSSPISFDFSNNSTYSNQFNLDGDINQIKYNVIDNQNMSQNVELTYNYLFDSRSNITNINQFENQTLNPNLSSVSTYDSMSRISSYDFGVNNGVKSTVGFQSNAYAYDSSSDRLSKDKIVNNGTNVFDNQIYEYLTVNNKETHQISKIKNANQLVLEDFAYDNNGNLIVHQYYTINNGVSTVNKIEISTYDRMNRLTQVQIQDVINNTTKNVNYELNSLGQRIEKNNSQLNSSNLFIYGSNNQIIAEYAQDDSIVKEYVYLNGVPIAFIQPKIISTSGGNVTVDELLYIYSDHLGTQRKITNKDNVLQWSWNHVEPFGDSDPISNSNMEFNLRFPGQYYDQETKTNYNLFRDYNSSLGRYVQSDPIGLSGGLNSYAYANQNPLSFSDSLGLFTTLIFVKDDLGLNHVALMINNKIYDINPGNNKKQNVNYFYSFFYFNPDAKNSDNENTGKFFTNYYKHKGYNSISFDLYHLKLSSLEEENLIQTFNSMSGNYNLFLNNCASFINHILSKNKIKKSTDMNKLMTPYLFQMLLEHDYTFKSRLIKKETKKSVLNYDQYNNEYTR